MRTKNGTVTVMGSAVMDAGCQGQLKPPTSFRRRGARNSIERSLSGFDQIHFQPVDDATYCGKLQRTRDGSVCLMLITA